MVLYNHLRIPILPANKMFRKIHKRIELFVYNVVKEKMKPTIFQSQSPRSIRQFTTPTPKILEQCILDAGINTKQPEKKYPEVIKEQPNKMVTQTTRTGKPQVSYPNNGEISND